ncbi:hypothetical protein PG993_011460 [Apiospora rasikravindrae]|uniref:Cellobiose dehydrogenase-like cytochrome domain-containing protein n=1 Tax=Apiospora rasikravindrae TaxID=990691 RepID=A0ABR1SEB5_9PEZI
MRPNTDAVGETASSETNLAPRRPGYGSGFVLPTNPTNSFIGQLTFPPNNRAGWGGWLLTGGMEGTLLMVAWSLGTNCAVSSFCQAANVKDNPPKVTGNFSVKPTTKGTSINNMVLAYNYLYDRDGQKRGDGLGLVGQARAGPRQLGWSSCNPRPWRGGFKADLTLAKRPESGTSAALAIPPVAGGAAAKPLDTTKGGSGRSSRDEDTDDKDSGDESDDDD